MAKAPTLRSESMGFVASYDGETTIRHQLAETPEVPLACEAERLDVLASILRRDSMVAPGAARMSSDERVIMLEVLADAASMVRRPAELNEECVNRLRVAKGQRK